jgi:hypothetical protein
VKGAVHCQPNCPVTTSTSTHIVLLAGVSYKLAGCAVMQGNAVPADHTSGCLRCVFDSERHPGDQCTAQKSEWHHASENSFFLISLLTSYLLPY